MVMTGTPLPSEPQLCLATCRADLFAALVAGVLTSGSCISGGCLDSDVCVYNSDYQKDACCECLTSTCQPLAAVGGREEHHLRRLQILDELDKTSVENMP